MGSYKNNGILSKSKRRQFVNQAKLPKHHLPSLVIVFSGVMLLAVNQSAYADDCNDIVESASFGGQLPLSPGMAVLSHYSGLYKKINGPDIGSHVTVRSSRPNFWVLSVVDIRDPANASSSSPSIAPIGDNWTEVGLGRYVHTSWLQSNLGEVFGIALEEGVVAPDIFVTPRSFAANSASEILPRAGGTGSEVFRIDGTTGAITVMTTLPGHVFPHDPATPQYYRYTGLGQITYNQNEKVVYVSNLDDGKIYAVDASGASNATNASLIGGAFDHGLTQPSAIADNPDTDWTDYARTVMAVGYNPIDKRLYYSVPESGGIESGFTNRGIGNQIWSVATDSLGAIDTTSAPQLEMTVATLGVSAQEMITDISFNADGSEMLLASEMLKFSVLDEVGPSYVTSSHNAALGRHYEKTSSGWSHLLDYNVGKYRDELNGRGGGDFGFNNYGVNSDSTNLDDSIVLTGDALDGASLDVYGIQISPTGTAVVTGTSGNTYLARTSISDNGNTDDRYEKMTYGDIEVFGCVPPSTVKIGNLVWLEDDNDGDANTGTITYPDAGTIVTATASDITTTYTGSTDANGLYSIDVPQNDTYTVTVATPPGFVPALGSDDSSVPDDTTEDNRSHNGEGTTVTVTDSDNLTLDFGFVPSRPDLNLTKDLDTSVAKRGETVVYTLTLENEGTADATGVKVTDMLPTEVNYVGHNSPEIYDDGTGVWDVGNVLAGASRSLLITVTVK